MARRDKLSVESYKGVRDFYPEDQAFLNYLFATYRSVTERFGYVEYHASILEPSELYREKGVENEEIINEQTYTFTDRGGREVTLRPEMTPTVARMVAARRRELGFPLRLYSIPNLFRYERPQRGRLREHWQLNVDLFGSRSPVADAEVISLAHELMREFGAEETDFVIRVGSRAFLTRLMERLGIDLSSPQEGKLLRLLDTKDKISPEKFEEGLRDIGLTPEDISAKEVPQEVAEVLSTLRRLGVSNAVFDPGIVRGFNYYTGMVFEVFDTHPDNRRAMFGGGRYDNLTELFDDEAVVGVGFGMGDVTIRDFLEVRGLLPSYIPPTRVYLAVASGKEAADALALAEELREEGIATAVDFGEKKLSEQIKTATKHHIPYLIVVGPNELASGTFTIKDLTTGKEESVFRHSVASFFSKA